MRAYLQRANVVLHIFDKCWIIVLKSNVCLGKSKLLPLGTVAGKHRGRIRLPLDRGASVLIVPRKSRVITVLLPSLSGKTVLLLSAIPVIRINIYHNKAFSWLFLLMNYAIDVANAATG